uniref:hypothetical protein n=1 Tax=Lachnoclostridium phocaeense TaxID=1871021 RepID=UPI0026DD5E47|nr:hypothetical protein [Lachnoclostridium phocaeense]
MGDYYNKMDVYDEKIRPLIDELKKTCILEQMPMFVTIAVENDATYTSYKSDMVLAGSGVSLTDNRISDLLLILNHFDAEYPEHIKRAVRELQCYMDSLLNTSHAVTEQKLSDDVIAKMPKVISCGDRAKLHIKPPDESILDDFWNDQVE